MSSPFPGMDPYLESLQLWKGVHTRLISALSDTLNITLPPGFVACIEERCYITPVRRDIYPDVTLTARANRSALPGSSTSVLERPETVGLPTGVLRLAHEETREPYLEIRTVGSEEQVITVIEVLSPTNKTIGAGRDSYRRKQEMTLNSEANLLEIDLLRGGDFTVSVPSGELTKYGAFDYIVCLHRPGAEHEYSFWLNRLRDVLPLIRVPLTEGYDDQILNLQAMINEVYERGRYSDRIHYDQSPEPPLSADDTVWANGLLATFRQSEPTR